MTLTVSPGGAVAEAEARKRPGRPRTHFPPDEKRMMLLQIAFAEIAEAEPLRLRDIAERADVLLVRAKMRRHHGLAGDALMILERAERRLRALKRQEAKG